MDSRLVSKPCLSVEQAWRRLVSAGAEPDGGGQQRDDHPDDMDVDENPAVGTAQTADGQRDCAAGASKAAAAPAAAAKPARRQRTRGSSTRPAAAEVADRKSGVQTRAERARMSPAELEAEAQQLAELVRKAAEAKAAQAAAKKRLKAAKLAATVPGAAQQAAAVPAQRPDGQRGWRC